MTKTKKTEQGEATGTLDTRRWPDWVKHNPLLDRKQSLLVARYSVYAWRAAKTHVAPATQLTLATQAKMPAAYLSDFLRGKRRVRWQFVEALASALKEHVVEDHYDGEKLLGDAVLWGAKMGPSDPLLTQLLEEAEGTGSASGFDETKAEKDASKDLADFLEQRADFISRREKRVLLAIAPHVRDGYRTNTEFWASILKTLKSHSAA